MPLLCDILAMLFVLCCYVVFRKIHARPTDLKSNKVIQTQLARSYVFNNVVGKQYQRLGKLWKVATRLPRREGSPATQIRFPPRAGKATWHFSYTDFSRFDKSSSTKINLTTRVLRCHPRYHTETGFFFKLKQSLCLSRLLAFFILNTQICWVVSAGRSNKHTHQLSDFGLSGINWVILV